MRTIPAARPDGRSRGGWLFAHGRSFGLLCLAAFAGALFVAAAGGAGALEHSLELLGCELGELAGGEPGQRCELAKRRVGAALCGG